MTSTRRIDICDYFDKMKLNLTYYFWPVDCFFDEGVGNLF